MAKIQSLLTTYPWARIYVYLADHDTALRFLQDAEHEGFTFGDGVKPTKRETSDIFAINKDMTLNYVGLIGHIAFGAADTVGGKPLVRIDYRDLLKKHASE